jgi:hypothetical protein
MPLHAAALFLLLTPVQCSSGGSGAGPCAEGAFAGQYQGTWGESGSETGTWQATVDSCGAVSGTGDGGAFTITGTIDPSGRMQFGATAENGTTTATFTGTGDAAGNVSGTWIDSTGSSTGTFHGRRISASVPDASSTGLCAGGAFAGQYQGTWGESGSETGTWQATVDSCGAVSGTGDGGAFTITGTIDSSGRMQFGATAEDGTITAIFTGTGDAAGNVSGTWIDSTGSTTGTFHGGRTSASGPDAAAPVGTEQPAPMLCDPLNDTCAVGTRCEFSCSDPPGVKCSPGSSGTITSGAACKSSEDCQAGSVCSYPSSTATGGTCIAACKSNSDCLAGQVCRTIAYSCPSGSLYSLLWCQ